MKLLKSLLEAQSAWEDQKDDGTPPKETDTATIDRIWKELLKDGGAEHAELHNTQVPTKENIEEWYASERWRGGVNLKNRLLTLRDFYEWWDE